MTLYSINTGFFKLDGGALAISDFEIMNYRPLIGCEDLLEITLDSKGELTSALFSTSSLVIKGSDSTIYNLTAGFTEERRAFLASLTNSFFSVSERFNRLIFE